MNTLFVPVADNWHEVDTTVWNDLWKQNKNSLWLTEHDTESIYKLKSTHWQFENWSKKLFLFYKYKKGKGRKATMGLKGG